MGKILFVNNLAGFEVEAPPPAVVRLNSTEQQDLVRYGSAKTPISMPSINLFLDLQGAGDNDTIIWLHWQRTVEQNPGRCGFWTPADKSLYDLLPDYKAMIAAYLSSRGYTVRAGQFATPSNVKVICGAFECARWVKDGDGYALEITEVAHER